MKTKIPLPTLVALAVTAFSLGITGCKKKSGTEHGGDHAHQYTCPMHPEVVQDTAGNCPKCAMKLVEKH